MRLPKCCKYLLFLQCEEKILVAANAHEKFAQENSDEIGVICMVNPARWVLGKDFYASCIRTCDA